VSDSSVEAGAVGLGKPVTVIGAGFSGLVSAFHLLRAGYKVTVLEASAQAGGLISSVRTPNGLIETAANGILASPAVEELFSEIGLEMIEPLKIARKRYIVRDKIPRRWPFSFRGSLRMARFFLRYIFARASLLPSDTVRTWARRVLGDEATFFGIEAALQGIYAGDPERLSAGLIFGGMFGVKPQSLAPALPKGSKLGTVSAPEGMGQLIHELRKHLEKNGVHFVFGFLAELPVDPAHPFVVAVSAGAAGEILKKHSAARAELLSQIELLPIVSATLFSKDTDERSRGFGCLFPPVDSHRVLGVLKNDFIFTNRVTGDLHSETWIIGGAFGRETAALNDTDLIEAIRRERAESLRGVEDPVAWSITRWPKALPHYTLELEKIVPGLQGVEKNVILIGNYLGQIGLSKILDRARELPYELARDAHWKTNEHNR
jgi:oxygen-dependent protoporphyrinogen oxidase